jgi:hypothetical protein
MTSPGATLVKDEDGQEHQFKLKLPSHPALARRRPNLNP